MPEKSITNPNRPLKATEGSPERPDRSHRRQSRRTCPSKSAGRRRIKFFTLGCKVNQYETQALKEKCVMLGLRVSEEEADVYVINGCSVTKNADRKSRDALKRIKRDNPRAKIVACGCFAQLPGSLDEALADYIIPQDKKHLLPEILSGIGSKPGRESSGDINALGISRFPHHRAFVKIQDGCDNRCSFCKIPHLRGRSRSREPKVILREIEALSVSYREIVICGINLGLYGRDLAIAQNLTGLLNDALRISTLGRVRLSSLEPCFFDRKLLLHFRNEKLCPHLHLPFQYGDDTILKEMNKRERVALYEDIVHNARKVNPQIAISCDIMVGFPGEDERSFQNTLDFLTKVRPMRTHIFSFSPREGTPLEKIRANEPQKVRRRYLCVKQLTERFAAEYRQKFAGETLAVIGESECDGFILSRADNYLKAYVEGRMTLGEIARVRVVREFKDGVLAVPAG